MIRSLIRSSNPEHRFTLETLLRAIEAGGVSKPLFASCRGDLRAMTAHFCRQSLSREEERYPGRQIEWMRVQHPDQARDRLGAGRVIHVPPSP